MPQYIQNTNIFMTHVVVPQVSLELFVEWQSKLNGIIANFPGFQSFEILSPRPGESSWTLVQRFTDAASASAWKESSERRELLQELRTNITQNIEDSASKEADLHGVTEVLITQVASEKVSTYRKWLAKIHQAEARFPGFRGMYVQSPIEGRGLHWITFLQFDTAENLDRWLTSKERHEILKESDAIITALESHRVITPYAGWFSTIAKVGEIPAVWKQTMLVLLVLFPIVMFELKFLFPLTKGLNISLATFIGNAISVILISWPMIPIAIWLFAWWLTPGSGNSLKKNIAGTFLLSMIYLIEIIAFWSFV